MIGWIDGWPWERRKLRRLGVRGKMRYNWRIGTFEHCQCDDATMKRLKAELPNFWPDAFSVEEQQVA